MRTAFRVATMALVLSPFAQAQHDVILGPNWVLNSCIATVPKTNTDSDIRPGAQASVTAQADHAACSITGIAQSFANVVASASTSASSQIQCSYSRGGFGALITCSGSHEANGTASAGGFVNGTFSCDANYSNSMGVSVNPVSSYAGGTLFQTVPGTFNVSTLATTFSYSTNQASSVLAQTFGPGSSLLMAGDAGVTSLTNL